MEKILKFLRLALLVLAVANEVVKLRTNLRKTMFRNPLAEMFPDPDDAPDTASSTAFNRAFDRAAEAVTKQARERGQQ